MRKAIEDIDIPTGCGILIKFQVPSTSKRITMMQILRRHLDRLVNYET